LAAVHRLHGLFRKSGAGCQSLRHDIYPWLCLFIDTTARTARCSITGSRVGVSQENCAKGAVTTVAPYAFDKQALSTLGRCAYVCFFELINKRWFWEGCIAE
jgi:hypothetical protein